MNTHGLTRTHEPGRRVGYSFLPPTDVTDTVAATAFWCAGCDRKFPAGSLAVDATRTDGPFDPVRYCTRDCRNRWVKR